MIPVHYKQVFSISVTLHIIISIIIVLLSETIGVRFLNTRLTIPAERPAVANWVFQFSVLSSALSHERMNIFAYVSILEVSFKLAVVYLLQLFGYDKLVLDAILIFLVSLILRIVYGTYCTRTVSPGRKNYLFAGRHEAAKLCAILYSLIGYLQTV